MKSRLLIILSPPRTFSSVVSTMIGEHPELYGFPELHLFIGDTLQALMDYEYKKRGRYTGPPGILRSLAQIHDGIQTTGSIVRSAAWISERRDWSTKKLMDYLLKRIDPLMGVEKSPVTALKQQSLERAYAYYPDAFYLHLTRHPIPTRNSMQEFGEHKKARRGADGKPLRIERLIAWHHMHSNILHFTNRLPLGQHMRIRGEDVLSEPEVYLPQLCQWLGIQADADAVETMRHPENSPYACIGPDPARGGNDPKFMRSPALRTGRIKQSSLAEFLDREKVDWFPGDFGQALRESELSLASDGEIRSEITDLAHMLGYE